MPDDYLYDDLFVMPVDVLTEGKSIASADSDKMAFRSRLNKIVALDAKDYAKKTKAGQSFGRKKMTEVQTRVRTTVFGALGLLKAKKVTESEFRKRVVKTMKIAWRDSFLAGVRASGVPGTSTAGSQFKFESVDGAWLKTAMTHEMRYLNKFLDAILEETGTMAVSRRLGMYVDSLSSFYDSARVIGLPKNTLLYWTGPGDKVTCPGCKYMFENSPFTKYTLPTTPRSGATQCLCLTDCRVEVTTLRGNLPFAEVTCDDYVETHRGRWGRVQAIHLNHSTPAHRYAVVVGQGGRLFGVTADHLVWTSEGFVAAGEAARRNLRVLPGVSSRPLGAQEQDEAVPPVRLGRPVVRGARGGEAGSPPGGRSEPAHALVRLDAGELQLDEGGREEVRAVLGGRHVAVPVPLPMGVDAGARGDSVRLRDTSSQSRLHGRPGGEFGSQRAPGTSVGSWGGVACEGAEGRVQSMLPPDTVGAESGEVRAREVLLTAMRSGGEVAEQGTNLSRLSCRVPGEVVGASAPLWPVLLSRLLQRASCEGVTDPCLSVLRDDLRSSRVRDREVEVGSVVLLAGVLAEGTPLYDMTVEDDHSFVVAGVALHNSNCRDRLLVRMAPLEEVQALEADPGTRDKHASALARVKAGR